MANSAPMLLLAARTCSGEKRFRVAPGCHVIGSGAAADLRLADPTVSRRHLELRLTEDGKVVCTDLDSSNGTWLDGTRITTASVDASPTTLRLGDVPVTVERLADAEVRLAVPGEGAATVVSPAAPSLATWGEVSLARFALRELPGLLERLEEGAGEEQFAQRAAAALNAAGPELSCTLRRLGAVLASAGDPADGAASRDFSRGDWSLSVTGPPDRIDRHEPLFRLLLQLLAISDRAEANGRSAPVERAGSGAAPPDPPTQSRPLQRLFEQAVCIAPSGIGVLIHGETGTGKELFARFLHAASGLPADRLVTLNCAALPEDLLEAELFGIEKGVATGVTERPGRFEQADRGTLFLDEIGDMAPATQARILRALQEQRVYRVGGRRPRPARVRVVSATNRRLEDMVEAGEFRRDLYHRLADWVVELPTLRQRRGDVANLAAHFLGAELRRQGKRFGGISEAALRALLAYPWPGNVRELEREMLRCALFLEADEPLRAAHLQDRFRSTAPPPGQTLKEQLERSERDIVRAALERADGDVAVAAGRLAIGKSTLYRRLQQLGLDH